jgi:F420-dependent oxidoreductase-like protein
MREYIEILRKIWAREAPVEHDGEEYQLPYRGPRATGLGKPLKSILHSRQLPIYLASLGPVNLRTAGELADGWLAIMFSPRDAGLFKSHIEEGFALAGNGKSWKDFDIAANAEVQITDDVAAGLAEVKPYIALYAGGMGAKSKNFYNDLVVKYGYADEAARIQELYLAGRKAEAIAAVPDELADEMSLVGPEARIIERLREWEDAGVTTLLVPPSRPRELHFMAEHYGTAKGAV